MSAYDDLLTALAMMPAADQEVASAAALRTVRVWLRDRRRAREGVPVHEPLPPEPPRDCYVLSDEEGGHG